MLRTKTPLRVVAVAGLIVIALVYAAWSLRRADTGLFRPELAKEFFRQYQEPDGRIVRRDQGSDTVSEGQAYGMLLAVALDDEERFARIWSWTEENLRRPDGLLAWRWDGAVVDEEPASDADVDAALALLLAGDRFDRREYTSEGRKIARATMEGETAVLNGRRVLVAGPWARERMIVNPSYISPDAFSRFAQATSDDRWREVLRTGVNLVEELTEEGSKLPPDWASLEGNQPRAIGNPDDLTAEGAYGADAPRVLLRFAASCDESARELSARLKDVVAVDDAENDSLRLAAAAAAAHASGDEGAREELLNRAADASRDSPTYYGWAWAALGPAFLSGVFGCNGV